jgi:hypothetical protein
VAAALVAAKSLHEASSDLPALVDTKFVNATP